MADAPVDANFRAAAGHDADCRGCATNYLAKRDGGVMVRDYVAYCRQCGTSIDGDYEHEIANAAYCRRCATTLIAAREKQ